MQIPFLQQYNAKSGSPGALMRILWSKHEPTLSRILHLILYSRAGSMEFLSDTVPLSFFFHIEDAGGSKHDLLGEASRGALLLSNDFMSTDEKRTMTGVPPVLSHLIRLGCSVLQRGEYNFTRQHTGAYWLHIIPWTVILSSVTGSKIRLATHQTFHFSAKTLCLCLTGSWLYFVNFPQN